MSHMGQNGIWQHAGRCEKDPEMCRHLSMSYLLQWNDHLDDLDMYGSNSEEQAQDMMTRKGVCLDTVTKTSDCALLRDLKGPGKFNLSTCRNRVVCHTWRFIDHG
jgi:hypothetical protein